MLIRSLAIVISVCCAMPSHAAAQECEMEIKEGSAARDLGRVLRCFDERLKALEARLNASGSGSTAALPERNDATFDAGSFVVTVRSAVRDNRVVRILLNIRNKTTEDLYLGVVGKNRTHIVTDEATGKFDDNFGISGLNRDSTRQNDYTVLPAGSVINVTLSPDARLIEGPDVSARIVLVQFVGGKPKTVTVPLSFKVRG